jgi:hypothetical protein
MVRMVTPDVPTTLRVKPTRCSDRDTYELWAHLGGPDGHGRATIAGVTSCA